jgi:hypothetical protein
VTVVTILQQTIGRPHRHIRVEVLIGETNVKGRVEEVSWEVLGALNRRERDAGRGEDVLVKVGAVGEHIEGMLRSLAERHSLRYLLGDIVSKKS